MPFSLQSLLSGVVAPDLLAPLLCLVLIALMIRAGVMDHPVHRSSHTRPIPKGGGIGIIGAFLLCLAPALYLTHQPFFTGPIFGLASGVILLAAVSWLDDLYSFPARYKLAAQFIAAALAAFGSGASLPMTGLFILGAVFITNALNFIDGINGLASGVMALAALFLAASGIQPVIFVLYAICLLAFLPCNFPKARIFMGDVGSQSGALIIAWGAMQPHRLAGLLTLALLSGVLWDVLFTLARRARAGDRLAQAHRGHLYQLAVRSGMPMPLVTMIYWGFVLWGALACAATQPWETVLLVLLPQLCWTGYICTRAKARVQDRW
ncbi:MraY family glycosyltransferase [Gluconobacter japonicus]|uniref:LPS biosynthesis protein n=1 Tax=Gluconobacter japonicus TaxID=376620 RepID=A0ABQ5WL35_GLUJA|nr:undecaprenyl-phosphate alpha N-acetylglucosaminyltransferase [Gluconobacter japonicus]KXV28289.1 UDP-phosphate alpha N-acetylglucosaminyltransferase [Gluconobacter japonicus]GAP23868.1 undecaprenyl-phosphate alpha N-acetylglucosaminyltransferase [Gluconobacter frateurii NBRC 101659]GBR18706.1 undecaprenyl-phosphate alpha N-acetylglucosaminyltransferase [Gluconobacter japonicus NBRC 3271]GLQ60950.1 LPS biosynthesis protein [Gluconobacter japonicus]